MKTAGEEYIRALEETFGIKSGEESATECAIKVESGGAALDIIARSDDAAAAMTLACPVADELPPDVEYSDMLDLLDISLGPLFGMPGVGRDPESGAIVLYAVFPFATVTQADFVDAVRAFIPRAAALAERLKKDV